MKLFNVEYISEANLKAMGIEEKNWPRKDKKGNKF